MQLAASVNGTIQRTLALGASAVARGVTKSPEACPFALGAAVPRTATRNALLTTGFGIVLNVICVMRANALSRRFPFPNVADANGPNTVPGAVKLPIGLFTRDSVRR